MTVSYQQKLGKGFSKPDLTADVCILRISLEGAPAEALTIMETRSSLTAEAQSLNLISVVLLHNNNSSMHFYYR